MTIKKLELDIKDVCCECPYFERDNHHSLSQDSGYDCEHPQSNGRRIIDDTELDNFVKEKQAYIKSQGTLFPITQAPISPVKIPDWCPLPDKKG